MPNISFFTNNMKNHIIRKHISFMELHDIHHIELICPSTEFRSDTLYIGLAADIADILRLRQPEMPLTIFSSDDIYRLDTFIKWKNLNLISTSYTLADLYNQVNKIWLYHYRWSLSMSAALCQGKNMEDIISTAGKMLNCYVFLFNPGFNCICHSDACEYTDPLAEEILSHGYLQYEKASLLNSGLLNASSFHGNIHHFTLSQTGNSCYVMPVSANNVLLAHLILIINEQPQNMDLFDMIQSLGNIVERKLTEGVPLPMTSNTAFYSLLEDYEQHKILSESEVHNRFRLLPVIVKTFMQCMIIHFQNTFDPANANFLVHQLTDLLPPCNLTIYGEEIVILYSSDKLIKSSDEYVDMEKFSALLQQFQASAIFSGISRFPERFYTLYTLSSQLIAILMHLNIRTLYPNVYTYDEHSIYLLIDFASRQFQSRLHHSDIIYLADASVIALARYDREHHSELLELLFYYLLNGCNVTRTAQMMYMHRNTVLNKVNKINAIIHLPLDDGNTQQRLLFSCQLVKYYQEYLCSQLNL